MHKSVLIHSVLQEDRFYTLGMARSNLNVDLMGLAGCLDMG